MNIIFVSKQYICFLRDFGETEKHKHYTSHLTISLNKKMHCKIDNEIIDCYGYILNSNVDHERFGNNSDSVKLVFIFEPCSEMFLYSKDRLLKNKKYLELSQEQYKNIVLIAENMCSYIQTVKKSNGIADINKFKIDIEEILKISGFETKMHFPLDSRVKHLIDKIRNSETIENEIIDNVCSEICLSRSRLLHLFKDNTGIPLKKYMQYVKFFKTWHYIGNGENITEACIHAGYSDSAHYSNFIKSCYGLSTKQELNCISNIYNIE